MTKALLGNIRVIRLALLCSVALTVGVSAPLYAFNPDEGVSAEPGSSYVNSRTTTPISRAMPRLAFPENMGQFAPQPAPSVNPLLPQPMLASPAYPPVDAATAAEATRVMQQTESSTESLAVAAPPPPEAEFVPPTPLMAIEQRPLETPTTTPPPIILKPPVGVTADAIPTTTVPTPAVMVESDPLSDASKTILSNIPSKIDTSKVKPLSKTSVSRMSPGLQSLPSKATKTETFDAQGLSIKVQRTGLDTNFELNRAYTALMGGDTTTAIHTYKNILSTEPADEDSLFALATIYHRLGKLEMARPYYAQLLKVNQNHRDGINNFMALIGDESPQEALAELERLEQRNPEFSSIPAQQGLLLKKLGLMDQARDKMLRAVELSPENMTYKYNLAVILDAGGQYSDASALYRLLIDAYLKGEKIPAPMEAIQKRLNFIASASVPAPASGT